MVHINELATIETNNENKFWKLELWQIWWEVINIGNVT